MISRGILWLKMIVSIPVKKKHRILEWRSVKRKEQRDMEWKWISLNDKIGRRNNLKQ